MARRTTEHSTDSEEHPHLLRLTLEVESQLHSSNKKLRHLEKQCRI